MIETEQQEQRVWPSASLAYILRAAKNKEEGAQHALQDDFEEGVPVSLVEFSHAFFDYKKKVKKELMEPLPVALLRLKETTLFKRCLRGMGRTWSYELGFSVVQGVMLESAVLEDLEEFLPMVVEVQIADKGYETSAMWEVPTFWSDLRRNLSSDKKEDKVVVDLLIDKLPQLRSEEAICHALHLATEVSHQSSDVLENVANLSIHWPTAHYGSEMAQMIDTCTSQIVGDDPSRERLEAMYAICTQMEGGVAQFEKTLGECLSGDERNALQSLARHKKESAFASEDSLLLKSCLVIREQFENLHLPLKEATKIALAKTIAIGDVDDIVWGYHHWVAARKESVWDDATMRNLTEQEQKALLINQTTYEVGSTLPKKKPKVL